MKKLFVVLGMVIIAGCYNDKADQLYPTVKIGCDTTVVTFAATVGPILKDKCATSGCHDAATKESGYDYSSYNATWTANTTNGKLIGTITHNPNFVPMPYNLQKMDDCSINKIVRWVHLGALNN